MIYILLQNVSFEFGAMTVDPQSAGYDPSPLIGYCKSLGVPYHYEEQGMFVFSDNFYFLAYNIFSSLKSDFLMLLLL